MMKRFVVVSVAMLAGLLWSASPAAAADLECNGTFSGTFDDVVVPENGVCFLNSSTVTDDIKVKRNGYLEARDTSVADNVRGKKAQTIYMVDSNVGGDVKAKKTAQVFLFSMTIDGDVRVKHAKDKVNICGVRIVDGDLKVARSGTDLLIGDPQAVDCPGNLIENGDVEVSDNWTDVELVVRGNGIPRGDVTVDENEGPSDKFVQDNTGGKTLRCKHNEQPFVGTPNSGFKRYKGQCSGTVQVGGEHHGDDDGDHHRGDCDRREDDGYGDHGDDPRSYGDRERGDWGGDWQEHDD
jgi:hypothetical protein